MSDLSKKRSSSTMTRSLRNHTQCGRQRTSHTSTSPATPMIMNTISSFSQFCESHSSGDTPEPPARLNSRSTQFASPFSHPSMVSTMALE